jgi:SAM-dependent methyltransferase
MTESHGPDLNTASADYDAVYYQAHLGSDEEYSWGSQHWRTFFTNTAKHIIAATNPTNVLDVGCARGLLVQAFVEQGVDAYGIDISEHAIESADPAIRGRLSVSTADKVTGNWDLITSVEVIEHMSVADAEAAIDAMCAASDRVLISSDPSDFTEPTHINVRPPADWAASFAERGFYRRTDVDLSFLTPWAVLYERSDLTARDVVHRYEQWLYPMRREVLDKRAALLAHYRGDGGQREQLDKANAELATLRSTLRDAEHRLLTSRDNAVALEAANTRLQREADSARARADRTEIREAEAVEDAHQAHTALAEAVAGVSEAHARINDLQSEFHTISVSRQYRVGTKLLRPLTALRRMLGGRA